METTTVEAQKQNKTKKNLSDNTNPNKTERKYNDQQKKTKKTNNDLQTITPKKKTIEQHEPQSKPGVNSGAPHGQTVPAQCEAC